jgi:hypothetical protein
MSRQKAINEHCKQCNYDELDKGTWLAQIESCTMKDCPLYQYRPLTQKTRSLSAKKMDDGAKKAFVERMKKSRSKS